MSQQAVPAPGFPQAQQEPSKPRPLNLRWGLAVLGLIIAAGLVLSKVWDAALGPTLATADHQGGPSAATDAQYTSGTIFSGGDTNLSSHTPVIPTAAEGQNVAQQLQDLQRIHQEVTEQLRALREQDAGSRAERALQSVRLSRLRSTADEIRNDLRTLKPQLAAWNTTLAPLMTNDQGRQFASDPERLRFVATALASPVATDEQIAQWESNLESLLDPIEDSLGDDANLRLPEEFVSELTDLLRVVRKALNDLAARRAALDAMLAQTGDGQPGSEAPTLEVALASHRAEVARKQAAVIAEARRQAREAVDRKLAEAEAARVEAEGRVKLLEIEARKEEAEGIEKLLADARAEAARSREAERQKAELVRRFEREWPRMRSFLVPFTSEGLTQPGGYGFEMTGTKGPVSLGKLQGMGMLTPDLAGLKKLYSATTVNRMNDRERGGFPPYVGGDQDWARKHDTIKRIQDFLNEFGPIMVEKGLLAP